MMRKTTYALLCVVALLLCHATQAQWNLTGNANATATSILGTTNAVNLKLTTRNLTRLVIDSNGKVGIGIAAPPNVFSVKGSGGVPSSVWVNSGNPLFTGFGEQTVGNADYILSIASSLANARPVFIGRRARGTLAAPTVVANNDQVMSFLSSGYDGTAFQNAAAIDFFVDGTPTAGSIPTRISFVTGTNATTRAERLKIGNTGDITMNTNQLFVQKATGNVGIGTISPTAKMDITGNIKIADGTQGAGKVLTSDAAGLATWQTVPAVAETDPQVAVTDTSSVPRWNGAALIGGTIKDDGTNVGIGTATPTAKLDVAGNVKIADGTQAAGKVLTSDAAGLATWQAVSAPIETDPKVGNLSVNKIPKWAGTTLADGSITDNGNVGIGESNPHGILHVSQPGIFSGVAFAGTGLNDLTADISGYTATFTTNYVIKIDNAGPDPNLIRLSSNGGSSFGSAIPIANPIILSNGVTVTFAATGGHTFGDQWAFSVSKGFVDLLVVDSGRVGINTKTPAATLDVVGGDARINLMTVGRGKANDSTNTAIGLRALANNLAGSFSHNTAVGFNALLANTIGFNNTAIGYTTLLSNTTGISNTATGISALLSNTSGSGNTANGTSALGSNTTGSSNTALGQAALFANTTGFSNVAMGIRTLRNNTTGSNLVAIGDSALFNQNGGNGRNTAVGSKTLFANSTGDNNSATGYQALDVNTTGSGNSAFGSKALGSNVTGDFNTAMGNSALTASTGTNNTAFGSNCLSLFSGSNLTGLGQGASVSAAGFTNATALGYLTIVNASNKIRIGIAGTVCENATGSWTASDGRFKYNVKEEVKGLEFINALRPVVYNFDATRFEAFLRQNFPADVKEKQMAAMKADLLKAAAIRQTGFIAQEVEAAAQKTGYDFNGVHAPENPTDNYSLSYEKLVVPLVKAVQELSIKNEELKIKNENKDVKIDYLQKQIDDLKAMMIKLMNDKSALPCPPMAGQ